MVFKCLVAVLLAICCVGSNASNEWNDTVLGWVAKNGEETIFVYKTPCMAVQMLQTGLHRAHFSAPNQELEGCWKPKDNVVVFVWSNHTHGWMYQSAFRLLWGA